MLSTAHRARFAAMAATCTVVAMTSMTLVTSTSAYATALPMSLTINAGSTSSLESLNPNSVSGGVGIYNGTLANAGNWNAYYNLNASSTLVGASASAFQTGSFSITNLTSGTVTYLITMALPTDAGTPQSGSFTFNGSVSGTLITSGGPGMLQTVGAGTSLWTAQTGGSVVDTLFDDPFMVQRSSAGATNFGSQSFSGDRYDVQFPPLGGIDRVVHHVAEWFRNHHSGSWCACPPRLRGPRWKPSSPSLMTSHT